MISLLLAGGAHAQAVSSPEPDAVTIARISDYLNELSTLWARFTQINSDGTLSYGTLVVQRPWRARLEYDPPDSGLILASGQRIAIFDRKSNAPPQQFPLRRTPLYLILKNSVDLTDEKLNPQFATGPDFSELRLSSPSQDYKGTLFLSFRNSPLALDGWTFADEFGNRTHVRFDSTGTEISPSPALFDLERELSLAADRN